MQPVTSRDFDEWLSRFRDVITGYDHFVDFDKVYEQAEEHRVELNILNSLIGSKDIESDFRSICEKYPEVLECIPILLAVRKSKVAVLDEKKVIELDFKEPNLPIDQYVEFMERSGLFDLIANHLVNNLFDYVTGVEVGLDSNGRKNRGGHAMEDLVASYLEELNLPFEREKTTGDIEGEWHLDLSPITNGDDATKRFDFVLEANGEVYAFEVNFYASGGSKLNETARSYKMLAEESESIDHFHFVWITDGRGWNSARKNLKETFEVMEHIYSIDDLENDILGKLILRRRHTLEDDE